METLKLDQNLVGLITTYGVRAVGVVVLLIAAWIIAGWVRRGVLKAATKGRLDETLAKFFANISRYLVLIAAVLTALSVFGIQTTSFAAVLGASGIAVGLALQGSLSNFAAGVMLLAFRPFKAGDVIGVVDQVGKVDEIHLFTTKLITFDNRLLIIPNGSIWTGTIENFTALDTRRVDVPVGVEYGADHDQVRATLEKAAESLGLSTEPGYAVVMTGLGSSSVDWVVRLWAPTEDYWPVKEKLTDAVKRHLDEAGIGIPFPQVDVHFDGAADPRAA